MLSTFLNCSYFFFVSYLHWTFQIFKIQMLIIMKILPIQLNKILNEVHKQLLIIDNNFQK